MSTFEVPICPCTNNQCDAIAHIDYCPIFGFPFIRVNTKYYYRIDETEFPGKFGMAICPVIVIAGKHMAVLDSDEWIRV